MSRAVLATVTRAFGPNTHGALALVSFGGAPFPGAFGGGGFPPGGLPPWPLAPPLPCFPGPLAPSLAYQGEQWTGFRRRPRLLQLCDATAPLAFALRSFFFWALLCHRVISDLCQAISDRCFIRVLAHFSDHLFEFAKQPPMFAHVTRLWHL